MRYLFFLLTVFILFGCKGKSEDMPYQFKDKKHVAFQEVEYPQMLGVTLQLVKKGDFLLVNDFHGDSLISFFNLKTKKIEGKLVSKGRGPGELMPPLDVQYCGDKLFILSRPLFSLNYVSANWEKESSSELKKLIQLPSKSDCFLALTDTKFVFSGMWDKRYAFLDSQKEEEIATFGDYPDYWEEEQHIPTEAKAMFHQCRFTKHPTKPLFASCSAYVLEIYQYDDAKSQLPVLVKKKQLGKYSYTYSTGQMITAKSQKGSDPKASEIGCSEDYIYIVTQSPEDRKKSDIMVLDWQGNPVKYWETDKYITCLAVDEKSKIAYCIVEDPDDKLVYFKFR